MCWVMKCFLVIQRLKMLCVIHPHVGSEDNQNRAPLPAGSWWIWAQHNAQATAHNGRTMNASYAPSHSPSPVHVIPALHGVTVLKYCLKKNTMHWGKNSCVNCSWVPASAMIKGPDSNLPCFFYMQGSSLTMKGSIWYWQGMDGLALLEELPRKTAESLKFCRKSTSLSNCIVSLLPNSGIQRGLFSAAHHAA